MENFEAIEQELQRRVDAQKVLFSEQLRQEVARLQAEKEAEVEQARISVEQAQLDVERLQARNQLVEAQRDRLLAAPAPPPPPTPTAPPSSDLGPPLFLRTDLSNLPT